ncbi:MAG: PspC domain-containing protein, partial [Actinomycetota bacterium]
MTQHDDLAPRWQVPRIDSRNRWIGGVAAGLAAEIGVQPLIIRVSFVVLVLAGGWGLVLYPLAWILLAVGQPRQISPYRPRAKGATSLHRHLAVAMIVLGLVLFVRSLGFGFVDEIVFPVGFVVIGFLIAWTRPRSEPRPRGRPRSGAG